MSKIAMWAPLVLALVATVASLSLRRTRWARVALWISRFAYCLLIVQAVLYFPWKSGFRVSTVTCEWTFSLALARHSLTNYRHILLFALFYLLTYAQLRDVRGAILWSLAGTLGMGLLVELSQGAARHGHCRMRDLIPDSVGAAIGLLVVSALTRFSRKKLRRNAAGQSL